MMLAWVMAAAAIAGAGWLALRVLHRLGWASPFAGFNWQAAWQAWRQGHPAAASAPSAPQATPLPHSSPPLPSPHLAAAATHAIIGGAPWRGVAAAILLLWLAWGSALWAYNAADDLRTGRAWLDWIVLRWPVITASLIGHRPDWRADAWDRHRRRAAALRQNADQEAGSAVIAAAARVLDAGFAASLPDAAWTTGEDGVRRRRMVLAAVGPRVVPQWPLGFHAPTMAAWREWANQWAAVALRHGGVPGDWRVDADGVVAPATSVAPPAPAPEPMIGREAPALRDDTRWGRQGLTWGQVRGAAPQPIPPLTEPLPPDRVTDVSQALALLGVPHVQALGGRRGLAVDTTWIRPLPAQAQRVLRMGEALAGQLGHGSQPLRIAYVEGRPGVLAVERPRARRQFVELLGLLPHTSAATRRALREWALPVCCGVTPDGQVVWADAAAWPHLLVGGTTGGGKTTALAAWLASLCLTTPPSALRLALVDPKAGSQFPWAAASPHVETVLTHPDAVVQLVEDWVAEADQRYEALATLGLPDLRAAHRAGKADWPYRLLVVDEFKDIRDQLDSDTLKTFERNLGRLGQKARGAGIHVWIATQHPLAETISSTLKANLPARLGLTVASATASRVILDDGGAEALTGKGDALFWHAETQRTMLRVQTPFAAEATWNCLRAGWGGES